MCAGAVGTPQLLMLSGIGPAGHLRDLGIEVTANLPGVGSNLQDHPVAMCCYSCAVPLPPSAYNHGETYAALRSALGPGLARPAPVSDPAAGRPARPPMTRASASPWSRE